MREYRGKRVDNGEWIHGYLIGNDVIVGDIVEFTDEYFCTEFWYKVDPETVGQYTGLKDRNEKDIYEGDISEGEHAIYLILWDEQKAQLRAKVIKTKYVLIKHCLFPLWQYVEDDGKCRFGLIGNRFDNPELLGEVRE
ncbi:YopX family protein [Paenibacillus macerans]|uniref:YopX protein domain-containing protein n=1 Tax=Paenibacillus macerans TaxID=44252 RepID=A0A6N8F288_PAEMA|nr:YopX family protein [Paenibacillus macerans]MDU5945490.1 YopX family protein [Paenibacillus macerans]MEC0136155.1 YopX family protein [Paenibacillus macerans]MUG26039.1 hypothetical protein [Paenibacillus macerans]